MTTTPSGTHAGRLELDDVRVKFGDFTAVDGVSFHVDRGDVRFLIGPNGAGKTTLIDAITGLVPSTGQIRFDNRAIRGKKAHQIAKMGLGRTFQTATVFEAMSVIQNVDIAYSVRLSAAKRFRQRKQVPAEVAQALETVRLDNLANTNAGELSHGQKQWLEIAMLLVQEPSMLLLDEPVAGMSLDERIVTGELIHRISESRTILVVEHDMDFLRRFAHSVTVMAAGRVLSQGSVAEVQADPKVQEVYLGRSAAHDQPPPAQESETVDVREVSRA